MIDDLGPFDDSVASSSEPSVRSQSRSMGRLPKRNQTPIGRTEMNPIHEAQDLYAATRPTAAVLTATRESPQPDDPVLVLARGIAKPVRDYLAVPIDAPDEVGNVPYESFRGIEEEIMGRRARSLEGVLIKLVIAQAFNITHGGEKEWDALLVRSAQRDLMAMVGFDDRFDLLTSDRGDPLERLANALEALGPPSAICGKVPDHDD